jgi:hypothetical protein
LVQQIVVVQVRGPLADSALLGFPEMGLNRLFQVRVIRVIRVIGRKVNPKVVHAVFFKLLIDIAFQRPKFVPFFIERHPVLVGGPVEEYTKIQRWQWRVPSSVHFMSDPLGLLGVSKVATQANPGRKGAVFKIVEPFAELSTRFDAEPTWIHVID